MLKNKKIFLAGHNGHVGTAILKKLKYLGYKKVIIANGDDEHVDFFLDNKADLKFVYTEKNIKKAKAA